jgi:NAD(P)H-dependent glutamate synthase small subunit
MGDPSGFLTTDRRDPPKRPVPDRVADYREIEQSLEGPALEAQAGRCMECGIPFCHSYGCPVVNLIPDWNDMVYRKQWRKALDLLHATNNFPEVTGRICPAPCEAACTLAIDQPAVAIRHIERQIADRGWENGWIRPEPAAAKTGRKAAVIGSGPTGLAAAQQLARAGHDVTVFEKADRVGGILRYGIPDFKLEKSVVDRRVEQMQAEGVVFETGVEAGVDLSVRYIRRTFDAVLIAAGAGVPRDLDVPGRDLDGIRFAMPFLTQQNRRNAGDDVPAAESVTAAGKNVVVIGGGDTGADCIGTSRRQGARSIRQLEILPEPPAERAPDNPWPTWPQTLRASSSHEEGCERHWSVATREFLGGDGAVRGLRGVRLEWSEPDASGRRSFKEVPGTEFEMEAELVLLAMGFVRVEHGPLVKDYGLATDARGNIEVDADFATSAPGVFAAGDAVIGASLVVRAIALGRQAAAAMDRFLRSGGRQLAQGAAATGG